MVVKVSFLFLILSANLSYGQLLKIDSKKVALTLGDTVNCKAILIDCFSKNKNAKELSIQILGNNNGWVVFDDFPSENHYSDFYYDKKLISIPESIVELNEVEALDISFLGLISLPQNLSHLSKLKSLNISFNKIALLNEIDKFQQLKNLTALRFYGCNFDKSVLDTLIKRLPNVNLLFSKEQYLIDMKIK
jgi:hypothetical protein